MAKNNLSPAQDILTRRFYQEVCLQGEEFFPNSAGKPRRLRGLVLDLLGYMVLPNGARVDKNLKISQKFGEADYSQYPDEWNDDIRARAEEIRGETDNPQDSD